jgi:hypothetical protein
MKGIIRDIEEQLRHETLLTDVNETSVPTEDDFIGGLMRQIDMEEQERGVPFTLAEFQDFVGELLENDPMYTYSMDAEHLIGVLWQKYQSGRQPAERHDADFM